jgi:hypothetical protein
VPYRAAPFAADLQHGLRNCQLDGRDHAHSMYYCQIGLFNDCLARALDDGDRWLGVFDVDEFLFRPALDGAELGTAGTLTDWLDSLPDTVGQMQVRGLVFGPNFVHANWTGPVTTTHLWRPATDANPHAIEFPLPADLRDDCALSIPEYNTTCAVEFAIMAKAEKSFVRTSMARIGGMNVHVHQLSRGEFWAESGRAPSRAVRMHHYQALSVEEALHKWTLNRVEKHQFYAHPRMRAALTAVKDTAAADLFGRVQPCMRRTVDDMFDPACTRL